MGIPEVVMAEVVLLVVTEDTEELVISAGSLEKNVTKKDITDRSEMKIQILTIIQVKKITILKWLFFERKMFILIFKIFSSLYIVKADLDDFDDCAKMFICQLNAKNDSTLGPVEKMMKKSFSAGSTNYGGLDVNRISARFDLAALTGKMVGLNQCKLFYGRCKIPYLQMKNMLNTLLNDNMR